MNHALRHVTLEYVSVSFLRVLITVEDGWIGRDRRVIRMIAETYSKREREARCI